MSNPLVLASLSVALVLIVSALLREARLRRALEKLLAMLLHHWRQTHAQDRVAAGDDDESDGNVHRRLP